MISAIQRVKITDRAVLQTTSLCGFAPRLFLPQSSPCPTPPIPTTNNTSGERGRHQACSADSAGSQAKGKDEVYCSAPSRLSSLWLRKPCNMFKAKEAHPNTRPRTSLPPPPPPPICRGLEDQIRERLAVPITCGRMWPVKKIVWPLTHCALLPPDAGRPDSRSGMGCPALTAGSRARSSTRPSPRCKGVMTVVNTRPCCASPCMS